MIWIARLCKLSFSLGLISAGLSFFLLKDGRPILIESLESKTISGGSVFNKIQFQPGDQKDVWLMEQSHTGVKAPRHQWDKIAIVVDKAQSPIKAQFLQLMSGPEEISLRLKPIDLKATCFMCHSSGPRVIRPNFDSPIAGVSVWDKARVALWNLRIKTYGPMELEAVTFKKPFRYEHPVANQQLKVKSCERCHDGNGVFARNPLTKQNFMAIRFMMENQLMPPPGFSISDTDRAQIHSFVNPASAKHP